jgi:N-formylglutamate deformylase
MPHEALRVQDLPGGRRHPEIVLGDRFGTSCAPWISDLAYDAFTNAGFAVARNAPFAGGYITETYGIPAQNMHALQIEIDRSLYMDEARIAPRSDFAAFRDRLTPVIAALAQAGGMGQALAAE